MTGELVIRRRRRRTTPMRTHRIGAALYGTASGTPICFPGIAIREPQTRKDLLRSGSAAALLHAAVFGTLLLLTWLAPPEPLKEVLREVHLLRDEPVPPSEPAPAPKTLAERRSLRFAPQAQAVAPQTVNPKVIASAAPAVPAEALEMKTVGQVTAPTEIRSRSVVVEHVTAVSSVATSEAAAVDVKANTAPALRGPLEAEAPSGPAVGPKQIVFEGGTSGTGSAVTFELGSSVREGIASNRDVLGSPNGAPLANVNTRVGEGYQQGDGGTGSGPGGTYLECTARPEVQEYLKQVRDRTFARWVLPPEISANQEVTLRFSLDAAGSAVRVDLVEADNDALGHSAVQALRSAAPFPPMSEAARCLARRPITATFRNPLGV